MFLSSKLIMQNLNNNLILVKYFQKCLDMEENFIINIFFNYHQLQDYCRKEIKIKDYSEKN